MKHIKIAAGLAHVNYGNIAGVVKKHWMPEWIMSFRCSGYE